MGCGASSQNASMDIAYKVNSPTGTRLRTADDSAIETESFKLRRLTASEDVAEPRLSEGLPPPPDAFVQLVGSRGRLPLAAIEVCLMAIGMRKGVLALALDAKHQPPALADGTCAVDAWWAALHPRTRIVVESKLKALESAPAVLLAVGILCGGAVGASETKLALAPVPPAELAATLRYVDANLDVDAMLGAALQDGAPLDVAGWARALPRGERDALMRALQCDGVDDDYAGSSLLGTSSGKAVQSVTPGDAPSEGTDHLAPSAPAAPDAPAPVTDDPLADTKNHLRRSSNDETS